MGGKNKTKQRTHEDQQDNDCSNATGRVGSTNQQGGGAGFQHLRSVPAYQRNQLHSLVLVLEDHGGETRSQSNKIADEDGWGLGKGGADSCYEPIRAYDLDVKPAKP